MYGPMYDPMYDPAALIATLEEEGLAAWVPVLEPLLAQRFADSAHGNLPAWRAALDRLPAVTPVAAALCGDAVGAPALELGDAERSAAREALLSLKPWRKGPFRIGDIRIDAEWQSGLKWDRVMALASPVAGRRVLDVGCGNGYYTLRMLADGARTVIGVDPTLLYVVQFQAICRFLEPLRAHVLPLRLDELPPAAAAFDSVFSMGVLYHQRAPLEHLRQLRDALRSGGELILETIVLPGEAPLSRTPAARYARMRNVWHLPTVAELRVWLERSGFVDLAVGTTTTTTPAEQRRTEWMPFESLTDALDPADPAQTVEGWPAPQRVVIVCRRRG